MKAKDVKEGMLVVVVACKVEEYNGVIGVVDSYPATCGGMFWIKPKFVPPVLYTARRDLSPMMFYCSSFEPLDPGIAILHGVDQA